MLTDFIYSGSHSDEVQHYIPRCSGTAHWCQLNVKASLELAFRLPRSQSLTGNARR
ncbi:MAG: hypothetical protein V7L27_22400 [Nostoc sp.]|uniref:hypothetical protein n=1 Tax=Nostoc sp. TaxID=1180 RepID=UPI002FF7B1FB